MQSGQNAFRSDKSLQKPVHDFSPFSNETYIGIVKTGKQYYEAGEKHGLGMLVTDRLDNDGRIFLTLY